MNVFDSDYFTDEDHCHSADGIDTHLTHLDLVPPSHYQGGCGNCVLAASMQMMSVQHRINMMNHEGIILPAGTSYNGPATTHDGTPSGKDVPSDFLGTLNPYDPEISDPSFDMLFRQEKILEQNDVSQISMQFPIENATDSYYEACNPAFQEWMEGLVNGYMETNLVFSGSPLGAIIWQTVNPFDTSDHIDCDAMTFEEMCDGMGSQDSLTGVTSGHFAYTEAASLITNGTVDEMLCEHTYIADPAEDVGAWWTIDSPCVGFQSVPGYVKYTPYGLESPVGMSGSINENGARRCAWMRDFFFGKVSEWVWTEDIGWKAAALFCNLPEHDCKLDPTGLACATCIAQNKIANGVIVNALAGFFDTNTCAAAMSNDFVGFDEDYLANKLREGPFQTAMDWVYSNRDNVVDMRKNSLYTPAPADLIEPSEVDPDASHAVTIIGWVPHPSPVPGREKAFIVYNSHGEADGRYYLLQYEDKPKGDGDPLFSVLHQFGQIQYQNVVNPGHYLAGDDWDNDTLPNYADSCPFDSDMPWMHYVTAGSETYRYADDPDCDGISTACDNCPYVWNPPREDNDGDGVRDQYDQDGDGVGDECDNCPSKYNAPVLDHDGDGVLDQFDLDGDGYKNVCSSREPFCENGDLDARTGGDVCDIDVDGDRESFLYPPPEVYDGEDEPPTEKPPGSPRGECAGFLWSVSADDDRDGVCDVFNFPRNSDQDEWYLENIDAISQGFLGYLKPHNVPTYTDYSNEHYTLDKLNSTASGVVSFSFDSDPPIVEPTRGYRWQKSQEVGPDVYHGYDSCIKNLVDVWKYYGGQQVAEKESPGHYVFHGNPGDFVPEEFAVGSDIRAEFFRSLDPKRCVVDNCIRFTREEVGSPEPLKNVDPLSKYIMETDNHNTSWNPLLSDWEKGNDATQFCYTPNYNDALVDDNNTNQTKTNIICTTKEHDVLQGIDELVDAPGLAKWFHNPDQKDSNEDGIGDRCSMWVDMENLTQENNWYSPSELEWSIWSDFLGYEASGAYSYDSKTGFATHTATGFPVKIDDPKAARATASDINNLANLCGGNGVTIKEKILFASQKMSFDVTGLSVDPVRTTMGACSCNSSLDEDCYGTYAKCQFPEDRGWDTLDDAALQAYELEAYTMEYLPGTYKPRYPGYRYNSNRTMPLVTGEDWQDVSDYWSNEKVAPVCRNQPNGWDLLIPSQVIGYDYNPIWDYLPHFASQGVSWDEEKGTHAADGRAREGCQEISSTYVPGQYRAMAWRHLGQQEPDDPDHNDTELDLDQKWLLGHKTKMRVSVKPYAEVNTGVGCNSYQDCLISSAGQTCRAGVCYDDSANRDTSGHDIWLRQWHSSPPDGPWEEDHDPSRPYTEEELDSKEGVVVLEATCGMMMADPILADIWYVYKGYPVMGRDLNLVSRREVISGLRARNGMLYAQKNEVLPKDGSLFENEFSAQLAASNWSLPVKDFAFIKIFDEDDNGVAFAKEFILGGRTADGTSNPKVWMRDSRLPSSQFNVLSTSTNINVDNPNVLVDKSSKRMFVFGDNDGRVWELVENSIGVYSWVGSWDTYPNGLYVDPKGEAVQDRGTGNIFYVAADEQGMSIQRVGIGSKGPEIKMMVSGASGPSKRDNFSLVFHSGRNQLVLYGGFEHSSGSAKNDVWYMDSSAPVWKHLTENAGALPARLGGKLIAGEGQKIFMIGGEDQYGTRSPEIVWELPLDEDVIAWRAVSGLKPTRLTSMNTSFEGTYVPGQPSIFTLKAPENSEKVMVEFNNPSGKLVLGVIEQNGDKTPVFIPEKASSGGKTSIDIRAKERWMFVVGPRSDELTVEENGSFTIQIGEVSRSSSTRTISSQPSSRYDVFGSTTVVADWTSLKVLESDAAPLAEVASVPMTSAADALVEGKVAFVADFNNGVKVLDVSEPSSPTLLGEEWTVGSPDSITKVGNYLYLGVGALGVEVVDVSDPSDPSVVNIVDVGDTVVDVSASGGRLFVSTLASGVKLFEVSKEGFMHLTGVYQNLGWVEDTEARGDELYVKASNGLVEIVDISDPANVFRKNIVSEAQSHFGEKVGADFTVAYGSSGALEISDLVESP